MTDKQYRRKLRKFIKVYMKMRTAAAKMREAGYMYPIGLQLSSHEDVYIQLLETDKNGGLEYTADTLATDGYQIYSTEYQGVRLLYLE